MRSQLIVLCLLVVSQCQLTRETISAQCLTDLKNVIAGGYKVYQDISAQNFPQALADAEAIVPLVQLAKNDCTSSDARLTFNMNCISDLESFFSGFMKVYNDLQAQNFPQALADAEAMMPLIASIKSDCFSSVFAPKEISMQCVQDVEGVAADVMKVYNDIESLNIMQAIADVEALVPAFKQAIADCTSSNMLVTSPYKFSIDCVTDVTKIVDIMVDVVKAVEASNWTQVFSDIAHMVPLFPAFKNDCL